MSYNKEFPDLNETQQNALLYYNNNSCVGIGEFLHDYNIPRRISRSLKLYYDGKKVSLRTVLNLFVTFFNVFERSAAIKLLFGYLSPDLHGDCLAFLLVLNKIKINEYANITLNSEMFEKINKELQK